MTDKTDSKERANFEAHMRKLNACTRLERQSEAVGGNYRTISVQRAWELWQAARASLAVSAGSEPVAYAMFADNGNIRLWSKAWIPHPDAKPLYLHPSPPEGMVGGWISVEDARKPPPGKPVVFWVWAERYQEDDDGRQIAQDASGLHLGEWREAEHGNYFDNYSTPFADREAVLWWMDPAPPTSSADSRKGE